MGNITGEVDRLLFSLPLVAVNRLAGFRFHCVNLSALSSFDGCPWIKNSRWNFRIMKWKYIFEKESLWNWMRFDILSLNSTWKICGGLGKYLSIHYDSQRAIWFFPLREHFCECLISVCLHYRPDRWRGRVGHPAFWLHRSTASGPCRACTSTPCSSAPSCTAQWVHISFSQLF